MNPVIRAQVDQFKEANPVESYKDNDYFECYTVFSIINGRLSENVEPFSAHLRGSEFGLDGVCVLIQRQPVFDADDANALISQIKDGAVDFMFVQAKSGEAFDYGEISKFLDAVYGFFSGSMEGESDQLDDLIAAKDAIYSRPLRKNPTLTCFYATSGTYQQAARIDKLLDAQEARLSDLNLFSSIEIHLLGARDLQEGYRAATSSNSGEIEFPKSQTLPFHRQVEQAYIGYIRADQLMRLATHELDNGQNIINQSVFFDNVRDFDPNSKINKTIITEVKNGDRDAFVFRNNGVTVIAKSIVRTSDRFAISDYQIVNGCQTTNILQLCREVASEINVPFRLIQSRHEDFITSIIVGTNTQNPVRDEQFWALRPFMKDLEEYSKQQEGDLCLFLERRENQYRIETVERTRIIRPTDLMKSVAAMYLYQPHRAARDFRGIRAEYEASIFLPDHNIVPYYIACYANYKFEFLVRNRKIERSIRVFKFFILFSIGYQFCKGRGMFTLRKKEQENCCRDILELLCDETKFAKYCEKTSKQLERLLTLRSDRTSPMSREQLRDTLRSDTMTASFTELLDRGITKRA